jgi:hypothetical protein
MACLAASSANAFDQLGNPTLNPGENLRHEQGIVNGLVVDRYVWRDAKEQPRSASLVKFDPLNGGRGGYADQFTYQVFDPETESWRMVTLDPDMINPEGGFGYFVSHERFRDFDANVCPEPPLNRCTIAILHGGEDDSPFGLFLPGTGMSVSVTDTMAVHEFKQNYPHWGTIDPVPPDGITPSSLNKHKKYDLPVTIDWRFIAGTNYPLWQVTYDLSAAPIDTLSVDMRGPYGIMIFDEVNGPDTKLRWGDKYKFHTRGNTVSSNSHWIWKHLNHGARYNILVAGNFEMGIVQTVPYSKSTFGSAEAPERGKTSDDFPGGACPSTGWVMPCTFEWAYQSIQFEEFGPMPSSSKKLAWGTSPLLGTSSVTDDTGDPLQAYPKISYEVWITFDDSSGINSRKLAASVVQ